MIGAVDVDALIELAWAAPLAALTVTIAWALVVYGAGRAADANRDGRRLIATLRLAVAAAGVVLFTAAIVVGLIVMTSKG
ncbi:MAG TPA: hypothetical protein VG474_16445 [Solirubrobacteraceae bacterium]|nr:hypothetical protein [Solirubrobacteraceae bacterium]